MHMESGRFYLRQNSESLAQWLKLGKNLGITLDSARAWKNLKHSENRCSFLPLVGKELANPVILLTREQFSGFPEKFLGAEFVLVVGCLPDGEKSVFFSIFMLG